MNTAILFGLAGISMENMGGLSVTTVLILSNECFDLDPTLIGQTNIMTLDWNVHLKDMCILI